ncbi:hypothetical protein PoB_005472300 [Plakobranchus ocellatus]|uniref:CCHC-type domain-containing protein n=1 Tax=Plakobranchus ocellatus TaxID=259542 RepID=A0AAV4C9L9_9GAST|nr:hypothetical protein PoB_005472300 [Plakobranchus ocellatus]
MEDAIDKFEKSRRSPSPKTRSTSPLTCYGCGNSGHFISQSKNAALNPSGLKTKNMEQSWNKCPDSYPGTARRGSKEPETRGRRRVSDRKN